MSAPKTALYIDPPSRHFLNDRLFAVDDPMFQNGDSVNTPYVYLRDELAARGISVRTADFLPEVNDGTRNIYVSVGMLDKYRRIAQRPDTTLSAFLALECPIVEPSQYRALRDARRYFKRIYSWTDAASLEPFVGERLNYERIFWPQAFDRVHDDVWERADRKFLVMINANKRPRLSVQELYTERVRAVAYFARWNEVDLYGPGWNEPPVRVGQTRVPYTIKRLHRAWLRRWERLHPDPHLTAARSVYRGVAAAKSQVLGQYTFALCFENMIFKGWITEKIFDCFYAGTVPVYWGAPDVEDLIPPDCYVDMRNFKGYGELRAFLKSMTSAQIQAYREAARAYLGSPRARPFMKDAFAEIFRRIIREDAGCDLV